MHADAAVGQRGPEYHAPSEHAARLGLRPQPDVLRARRSRDELDQAIQTLTSPGPGIERRWVWRGTGARRRVQPDEFGTAVAQVDRPLYSDVGWPHDNGVGFGRAILRGGERGGVSAGGRWELDDNLVAGQGSRVGYV